MFKQKDTVKFKKVMTFTIVGQKHSRMEVVYGKVFQTMRMVSEDGAILLSKRYFRLHKMPRWLGLTFIEIYRKPTTKLQKKVLELDAKLGQK